MMPCETELKVLRAADTSTQARAQMKVLDSAVIASVATIEAGDLSGLSQVCREAMIICRRDFRLVFSAAV